jgi:hypothetical protein
MAKGDTFTTKQAKFIQLVGTDGMGYTAAYRIAYNPKDPRSKTTSVSASQLAKTPKVRAAIDALLSGGTDSADAEEEVSRATREWVTQKLQAEALDTKSPPASRIRALELLGKTHGMFKDMMVTEDLARTTGTIEEEIEAKLMRLLGGTGSTDKGTDSIDGGTGSTGKLRGPTRALAISPPDVADA